MHDLQEFIPPRKWAAYQDLLLQEAGADRKLLLEALGQKLREQQLLAVEDIELFEAYADQIQFI